MKLCNIFFVAFLLISALSYGQYNKKVMIFHGPKAPFRSQIVLDLSYKGLNTLPINASNQKIEILILDNNKLKTLPNWIGNLKNLRVLSVRNNDLIEVNSLLSFCSNLEQLYLSGNINLANIPNLSSCESLRIIDLIDTKIVDVPLGRNVRQSLLF